MKKVYILSVLVLFAVSAFAQKQVGYVKHMPAQEMSAFKTPTDTLEPGNMANFTGFTLFGSAGGGYVVGCNGYGDYAKGEAFIVVTPYKIEGAIYWFGGKTEVTGAGTVAMQILAMDGTDGTTTAGTGQTCPNTILKSDVVSIGNIDTSSLLSTAYIHTFSSVVNVSNDYCIAFDIENCYPDTIGLVSTADGDGGQMELAWDKWSDGAWYTMLEDASNWGLDFDAVIMPIVDMTDGIVENSFINGLKMSTYPNPAVNNVTLSYELQNSAEKVLVRVLDASGKVVEHMNLGSQNAGAYTIDMDVANYAAGTYYYLVNAGEARMAIKMNITK